MSEFVYEAGLWQYRARIAREAGVELGELGQALNNIVWLRLQPSCQAPEYNLLVLLSCRTSSWRNVRLSYSRASIRSNAFDMSSLSLASLPSR